MTSNRNAAHHPQPTRPAFAAGPSGRRPGRSQPRPGRAFSVLRRGSPARRRWLSRRSWLALAAGWFALSFGAAAQAALSASPNPSATGAYTVSWTAIADATRYHLYEDGTLSYAGTARSKAYSGKDPGAYTYTLTYCLYVAFPADTTVCDRPSNFDAVEVTVSGGDDTPTVPAAPVLTVPETSTSGSYTVSWTRPSGAASYQLQEKTNSGAWGSAYSGANRSKAFSGKSTAVYSYRVKACAGATDCGGWSATGSVRVTRATSTVSANPNPAPGGNFTVSWTASALVSSYRLSEDFNHGAATAVYSVTGESKSFADKAPGTYVYSLQVCFNLLGGQTCVPRGSVTVTVPEPAPTGTISASPSPCVIATGQNRCTTTVTWSSEHVNRPCIFMSVTQARFECGASGSKDAPWIGTAGSTFLLKVDNTFSSDTLDSATVAGVREPTVAASFDEETIALGDRVTLTWSSQHASTCRRSPGNVASAVSGTHVYTPGRAGEFRVTVTCAGAGGSGEDTATVDVNTPPEAADDTGTTRKNESVTVRVLTNDRDADNDPLRVVSATRPTHGTTRVNNGRTVTYTPDANHVGSDSFDYTISDEMDTDSATVTVTVTGPAPTVPAAPVLTVPETSTTGSYTVSWTRPSGATAYRLEERAGSGDWRPVHRGAAASKSFSNKRSGSYAYRARACAGTDNCGDWSATGTIAVTRATSTLSATPNPAPGGNFTVRWTASAVSSLYRLQESVDGGAAVQVYAGSARSQRFTGKAPASYDYSLKVCFSLFGNEVCLPSGSVTVTVPEPDPTGSISAAPSPCVIATGQNRCTTTVTWSSEHVNRPCIFMSVTQARFECGASGSKDAPWIGTAGSTFLLKVDNTFSSDTLDSATVAGVREPTVAASFDEETIALGDRVTLTWSSQHASTCRRSPGNVASAVSGTHVYTPGRAGEFRVTVTCAGAGGSAEDTATVDVNTPPEAADDTGTTRKNESVTVRVLTNDRDADNDPLRVVSATRPAHGTTRVNNGRTVTYTPNANHVGSDSFDYTISDEVDTDSATVTVTVTPTASVPNAPERPNVEAAGARSLTVTWTAPSDNGSAIVDYDVGYRVGATGGWTPHPFTGDGTMTTIGGLQPYTLYTVRVRAENGVGESAWSEPGSDRTDDVVPGRPNAPGVEATGSTTLSVTWAAPVNRGSDITDYDIEYKTSTATRWEEYDFTGTGRTTTIAGLTPATTYQVRVRAENGHGESP